MNESIRDSQGTRFSHTKPAFCPGCRFYGLDCNPDSEDWTAPCDYYETYNERDD